MTTPMITALLACRPAAESEAPGVYHLGPETPSVGIYDVEATPDAVYVSNLHVPFVTIADPATGERMGAFDLRDGEIDHALFPTLEIWDGRLWVSAVNEQRMLGFDLDTGELTTESLPGPLLHADDGGLYATSAEGVWRYDGEWAELEGWTLTPSALDVEGQRMAATNGRAVEVLGEWSVDTEHSELSDVLLLGEVVFVTDRLSGEVLRVGSEGVEDSLVTGSDTFALEGVEDDLLVTNRQGAALPDSGSYEGAPGRVTRLTTELQIVWTLDLDKTIHSLAWDGSKWWTANEDALRLSSFTSEGVETLRGARLGMTIDHLAASEGELWAGSHLTDELWVVQTGETVASCGWPFQVVPFEGKGHVVCQESGELQVVDLASRQETSRSSLAETFHRRCEDGLCTGHDALIGAGWSSQGLLVGDPREGRVLIGDDWVELEVEAASAPSVQHMGVVELGDAVVVYEPRDGRLVSIRDGQVVASVELDGLGEWPLVLDGEVVWAGSTAYDEDLVAVGTTEGTVLAPGVALEGSELVTATARLSLDDLREPPYTRDGQHGPIRVACVGDELWVASVFRGTVERRDVATLEALGTD